MQKFNFADGKKSFTLQSRKPAIGYDYAIEHIKEICQTGKIYLNGKEFPIPWQFKNWYKKRIACALDFMQLDSLKTRVQLSFEKVLEKARERRKQVFKKFGFWNIKTKFLKEFNLKC